MSFTSLGISSMWVAWSTTGDTTITKEHLFRYVVRRGKDLIETIIPFFIAHPMQFIEAA